MPYVNLHMHSEYSVLDGLCGVPEVLDRAVALNMEALAITDHGTVAGVVEFYQAAQARGIKPILGMEGYLVDDVAMKDRNIFHIVLLAQTTEGYRNLLRLSSLGFDNFYYSPRLDWRMLQAHREGLYALTGCLSGRLSRAIQRGDDPWPWVQQFQDTFGDHWAVEIHNHGLPDEDTVRPLLIDLARQAGRPIVATVDNHYVRPEDALAHQTLIAIQTKHTLAEMQSGEGFEGFAHAGAPFYLLSDEEMRERYPAEALAMTQEIAASCDVHIPELDQPQYFFPHAVAQQTSEADQLTALAWEGLENRIIPRVDPDRLATYCDRMEEELQTIIGMGFPGYFLVVADYLRWARQAGIPVGPGRGSVGGSLVAYCLGIHDVDPIRHDLVFSRFLNASRVSMPDVDSDFGYRDRLRVLGYLQEKYGAANVAHIGTFGSMGAKAAIKDVSRTLGLPFEDANALTKLLPEEPGLTWDDVLTNPDVVQWRTSHATPEWEQVWTIAQALTGKRRHRSVHASAVVIAPDPIAQYCGTRRAEDGDALITQADMHAVESLGLVKMDILGLRTLDVIVDTERVVGAIDWDALPLDDPKTLGLLADGHTVAVFQFESSAAQAFAREMEIDRFEDIVAASALNRPGPLDARDEEGFSMAEHYIRRKHRHEAVAYPAPETRTALQDTYGIMVYQEQYMRVAQDFAGYTMVEADNLRKIIGKKQMEKIADERTHFIARATESGRDATVAAQIFAQIETAARYSFNKSHAVAYSLLTYRTAYLKAHYPAAFMAAAMTSVQDKPDKLQEYLAEARRLRLILRPPSIQSPQATMTVLDDRTIQFPLTAIKGVGRAIVEHIILEAAQCPFRDLEDFLMRVRPSSSVLEALAKVGCFDGWAKGREALIQEGSALLALGRKIWKREDDFRNKPPKNPERVQQYTAQLWEQFHVEVSRLLAQEDLDNSVGNRLYWEHILMGAPLSVNPEYVLRRDPKSVQPLARLAALPEGAAVHVHGIITATKMLSSERGQMAQVQLQDESGVMSSVCFAGPYANLKTILEAGRCVHIRGRRSAYRDQPQLMILSAELL